MKVTPDDIAGLELIADAVDGRVHRHYSGRGMYGKCCVGIVADDAIDVIERAAQNGYRGAAQDSMGKGVIVYWPKMEDPY